MLARGATLVITFAIYGEESSPDPIWSEELKVAFKDGDPSVQLGTISPLDAEIFDGSARWLGVTVGADPDLGEPSERVELLTAPSAAAKAAETAGAVAE